MSKPMTEYEKNRAARERRKAKDKLDYPLIKEVVKYLKVGDLVSFKGTKGSPFRKIILIKEDTIIGSVVHWFKKDWVIDSYSSENSIYNLTDVRIDGQWASVKTLIKKAKI